MPTISEYGFTQFNTLPSPLDEQDDNPDQTFPGDSIGGNLLREIVFDKIITGTLRVNESLQSKDYVALTSGWKIWDVDGVGYIEAQNIIAGNYIQVFRQDAIPTSVHIGDLWVDTDAGNKLYVALSVGADQITAGEWVDASDEAIATAQAAAEAAQSDATTALAELDDVADDAKITPVEKLTIKPLWDAIVAEKSDIDTQADTYSVSKTDYGTAYTTLDTYLNTTIDNPNGVFNDMTATSDMTRATWDAAWEGYYNEKIEILQAIADATALLASWDGVSDKPAALYQFFYQSTAPASGMSTGDYWVDSDDNKSYRYDGESWLEIQDDDIATAVSNAATAQAAAEAAQADATTSLGELSDISSDAKITPVEKLTVKPLWNAAVAEKTNIDTQADVYSVSKTAYGTAYDNLNGYLNTTISVFDDMSSTTNITRADWDGFWEAYYDAKVEILQAIADAVSLLANWAGISDIPAEIHKWFYQSSAPESGMSTGDYWVDSDDKKLYRYAASTWGEIQDDDIATAISNAGTAQAAAEAAQGDATTALSTLSDIADDAKVTPVEKLEAKRMWDAVVVEGTATTGTIPTQATAFGVADTDFDTAYAALDLYLNTTISVFDDMDATTDITRSDWNTAWNNYHNQRTLLLNAIATKAKDLADAAQGDADTAITNAATAQSAAEASQGDATTALSELDDIAADTKITPVEKLTLLPLWNGILAEKTDIDSEADTFGVSKTAYGTAYDNLYGYIVTTLSTFDNMAATTDITRATWNGYFEAYYNAKIEILNAISTAAKTLADDAQTDADTAISNAATAQSAAETAQAAAEAAQSDADTGIANAATAQGLLDDIAADTKITPVEKLTIKPIWDDIVVEGTATTGTIPVQATAFGVADTDFDTAYAALNVLLNTTYTVFGNMATTTTIVRATWDTAWKNYYDERTQLLNAIATAAKALADTAQSAADDAQADADTAIANAATAQSAAETAQSAAEAAQGDATTALNALSDIAADTKITPVEKLEAKTRWDAIVTEGTATTGTIPVQATAFGVADTDFDTAYAALDLYLNTTITVFGNMSATTTVVRADWDTPWKNYYDERTQLLNAIATAAKDLADAAQADADTAIANAATAQAAAEAAQGDATTSLSELDDIADDAKITPVEKLTLKPLWDAVVAEKTDIDTQADSYSVSKTAYGTAYDNLYGYVITSLDVFNDMGATTNITRTTWDGYWEAYYNAKIEILNAIADATALLADWSGVTGASKPEDNADVSPNFPSDENLVGYWSLDEGSGSKAYDGSGNSNDGVLTNMTDDDWIDGVVGKALDFDGSNDRVMLGSNYSFAANHSLSFWAKIEVQDYQGIASGNLGSYAYLRFGGNTAENSNIYFETNTEEDGGYLNFDSSISFSTWYHFVITQDNAKKWSLYINGVLQAATVTTTNNTLTIRAFGMGRAGQDFLKGSLDEIRIYNKALTAKEVSALYKYPAGSGGATAWDGLVGDGLPDDNADVTANNNQNLDWLEASGSFKTEFTAGEDISEGDAVFCAKDTTTDVVFNSFANSPFHNYWSIYGANYWGAQGFKPKNGSYDVPCHSIDSIKLTRVATVGSPSGTLTLYLYARSSQTSYAPTGSILATATATIADIDTGQLTFTFSSGYVLDPAKWYCFVIKFPDGDSSNYLKWYWMSTTSSYESYCNVSGKAIYTSNGSTWTIPSTFRTFEFLTTGTSYVKGSVYLTDATAAATSSETYMGIATETVDKGDTLKVAIGGGVDLTNDRDWTKGQRYYLADDNRENLTIDTLGSSQGSLQGGGYWQSFTATFSKLTEVEVRTYRFDTSHQFMEGKIYEGEGVGGNLLATSEDRNSVNTVNGWASLRFQNGDTYKNAANVGDPIIPTEPVVLVPGNTYTIEYIPDDSAVVWYYSNTSVYSGGRSSLGVDNDFNIKLHGYRGDLGITAGSETKEAGVGLDTDKLIIIL